MSKREEAIALVNSMSDEQAEILVMFIKEYFLKESIPNPDTVEAFAEFDEMKSYPQIYKRYSLFKEIIKDIIPNI